MSSKEYIPLRTFDGFLKQHARDALSAPEQRLFDTLFPAFQGNLASADTGAHDKDDDFHTALTKPLAEIFSPLIQVAPAEVLPRRFAGYELPRRRYFTLCHGEAGNDLQTLAHELRAYRYPVNVGLVEVIDLAQGCTLSINDVHVPLPPQHAIAVLIHEPEKLPPELYALDFVRLPGLTRQEMFLYRFPFTVSKRQIPRTIDLRFPEVRGWFYRTFRVPSELSDSAPLPANWPTSPTVARSRFHFENGVAPIPNSFWDMLPTLINPDLGGGTHSDTGSTLLMVGHWMRQHDVNALVFPSSRCDSAVVFEGGEVKHWQGWNLVEFAGAPPLGGAQVVTFVPSPWAWTNLPASVKLHVPPEHSALAGSFAVGNMVNHWASDYLGQLRALEVARSAHGQEPARDERKSVSHALAFRAFRIGVLCLRWLREVLERVPANEIQNDVLELQGLALPYGLYPLTGRMIELWNETQQRAISPADMVAQSLVTCDLVQRSLRIGYPGQDIDLLTRIGADVELMLCFIVGLSEGSQANVQFNTDGIAPKYEKALQTRWLNEELRIRARAFYRRTLSEIGHGGGGVHPLCEEGIAIQDAIYQHLRFQLAS